MKGLAQGDNHVIIPQNVASDRMIQILLRDIDNSGAPLAMLGNIPSLLSQIW